MTQHPLISIQGLRLNKDIMANIATTLMSRDDWEKNTTADRRAAEEAAAATGLA